MRRMKEKGFEIPCAVVRVGFKLVQVCGVVLRRAFVLRETRDSKVAPLTLTGWDIPDGETDIKSTRTGKCLP